MVTFFAKKDCLKIFLFWCRGFSILPTFSNSLAHHSLHTGPGWDGGVSVIINVKEIKNNCRFVQVAFRKKIRVNDNMSMGVQRSPTLGKGTNDHLFPLASLLNINELGHMLRPRLRNNRAIILSGSFVLPRFAHQSSFIFGLRCTLVSTYYRQLIVFFGRRLEQV